MQQGVGGIDQHLTANGLHKGQIQIDAGRTFGEQLEHYFAVQHGDLLLINVIKSKSQALKPRTCRHQKSNQARTTLLKENTYNSSKSYFTDKT